MNEHKIMLSLGIYGYTDIDTHSISKLLNAVPDMIHHAGRPVNPKFAIRAKQNAWIKSSDGYGTESFSYQLRSLLNLIEHNSSIFLNELRECTVEIKCAIEFNSESEESLPETHLSAKELSIISCHGIHVDFDFYIT